ATAASSGSPPLDNMSYATWIAGRPSACLLRNPLADEITIGLPANDFPSRRERSRTLMAGSAGASVGSARPAAAAAPAPRKSRRLGATMHSSNGYGCEIPGRCAASKSTESATRSPSLWPPATDTLRRMSAPVRDQLRQAHFLEG